MYLCSHILQTLEEKRKTKKKNNFSFHLLLILINYNPSKKGEHMLKYATPAGHNELKINIDEFLTLFKENKAVLLDIRMPFEKKVWSLPIAIDIPADRLEEEYKNLPKDKLIVTACPGKGRSPFAAAFLVSKDLNAKFLEDGLIELMAKLKGGAAKQFLS
jgi:rhodanese-related sulfurtransferase